jgi:hypothetical protein
MIFLKSLLAWKLWKKLIIQYFKGKPLIALEFLADIDKEEAFKKAHPSIYNNILVKKKLMRYSQNSVMLIIFSSFIKIIGFSLINRPQIAIEKLKTIFEQELNAENKLNGKIFTFTVKIVWA